MADDYLGEIQPLIELQHVSKRFKIRRERQRSFQDSFIALFRRDRSEKEFFWPLQGVSFAVNPGDSVGILGPNGSGKSTLLKLISGILDPTDGEITVAGRVASLLELGAGFHPDLTGRENIFLNGSIHGINRKQMLDRLDKIIDFAELGDFIDTPVKHYSSGMYVRLGFSVAIHSDPDILVVDEVLTVGDHVFQQKCLERIQDLKRKNIAIILVSHSLSEVERLCNRALWLHEGNIRLDGDAIQVVDEYAAFSNDVYYQKRSERQRQEPDEFTIERSDQRWGTGDANITQVELLDASGLESECFSTGDPFHLRIHYRTRNRLEKPAFGLAFYRQDGTHINGPNSVRDGYDISYIDGHGIMNYVVDPLLLVPGKYQLTVAIYNEDSSIAMDHHHRLYEFEVKSAQFRDEEGVVHFPATWRHDEDVQPLTDHKGDSWT